LIFPTWEEVIALNRYHIEHTTGLYLGPDNLLHPGSLDSILYAIQNLYFGVDRYPTLVEKSAALSWTIIDRHVFHDGNKRTGISILEIFLRANGYEIAASNDELMQIAIRIAKGSEEDYSLSEFTQWIRSRLYRKALYTL